MRITTSCSARLPARRAGAVPRLHGHLELGGRRADLRRVCGHLPEHRRRGNGGGAARFCGGRIIKTNVVYGGANEFQIYTVFLKNIGDKRTEPFRFAFHWARDFNTQIISLELTIGSKLQQVRKILQSVFIRREQPLRLHRVKH
jgi:hypothetical protein